MTKNIEKSVDGAVMTMRLNDIKAGWEQWFLLMSDNHHDSIYCDRKLELEHFEEAKKRNARIMIFGDWFDTMQGRFDPRRSMDELRPEYRREDYYDFVVKDCMEFLSPYAHLLDLMADGNHELSVLKNSNTNLLDRLVYALRTECKSDVIHGGYGGWVRMMFNTGMVLSYNLKYFHGAGAEAPVTRGVIQTNRQAVYLPDADIVVNGHNHNAYYVPISRERISDMGKQFMDIQHHVRIPGYKNAYGNGTRGWEVTKGGVPKPVGAVWMRAWFDYEGTKNQNNRNGTVRLQFIPDVRGSEHLVEAGSIYSGRVYEEDREAA